MRHILTALMVVILIMFPWLAYNFPLQLNSLVTALNKAGDQVASIVMNHKPKTVDEIQSKYAMADKPGVDKKVKVMIIPGHEPDFGGAEYLDLKEREMTVELSKALGEFMANNKRYEVHIARDERVWSTELGQYFKTKWDEIIAWHENNKAEFVDLIRLGKIKRVSPSVLHNDAPKDSALRLYGISKWSEENDVDIILHVHFNDYPRKDHKSSGKYSGFSIYVPEKQYYNSATARYLADKIFTRLEKFNPVSNFPGESSGIIEDQDLIAVGSYNSINAPSILIEYGYIYEPQFQDKVTRDLVIRDLAYQTYLGLQDFFEVVPVTEFVVNDTILMPSKWQEKISENSPAQSILSLQTALILNGVYPPSNKTKNDCPRTGIIGNCTKTALEDFQKKHGITGESGIVGEKTIGILNQLYSLQTI